MNTKLVRFLSIIISISMYTASFAQTFCLQLEEVSNDGEEYVVSIQLQGSETFKLGTSNLQFSASDAAFDIENGIVQPSYPDFIYTDATVTSPGPNAASFNIVLGPPGYGYEIAAEPNWTEIVQIRFPILDINEFIPCEWEYLGGTTQTVVYMDDEITQIYATDVSCLLGIEAVGIEPSSIEDASIEIYPNPINNILNVDFKGLKDNKWNVSIINAAGQNILAINNITRGNDPVKQIDLSHLNTGIYFVEFQSDQKSVTKRISVVK